MILIVTPHPDGFWMGDMYEEPPDAGDVPDWYCSGKIGGSKEELIAKAKASFPLLEVVDGVTGVCCECGTEHFALETICIECGEEVVDED